MQRRLTEVEEKKLREIWDSFGKLEILWDEIDSLRRCISGMVNYGTTDGLPYVEPTLTDDDMAKRIWVMCRDRDSDEWAGPSKSAAKSNEHYYAFMSNGDFLTLWMQCRRATPAEIAAAGLEVAE
jgi:hypothetical protein